MLGDAATEDGTEFREGLEGRRTSLYRWGFPPTSEYGLKPPTETNPAQTTRRGAPATASHYGEQRPISGARGGIGKQTGGRSSLAGGDERMVGVALLGDCAVQPSHRYQDGRPPDKEVWLLVEWPESEKEPIKYFLCDMPADYTLRRFVRIAKCRWKIEQDYQQLKEELGLDHYEGRNWQGWHHHVTLVMIAHAFLTLETLRSKKNFWVDPAADAP